MTFVFKAVIFPLLSFSVNIRLSYVIPSFSSLSKMDWFIITAASAFTAFSDISSITVEILFSIFKNNEKC